MPFRQAVGSQRDRVQAAIKGHIADLHFAIGHVARTPKRGEALTGAHGQRQGLVVTPEPVGHKTAGSFGKRQLERQIHPFEECLQRCELLVGGGILFVPKPQPGPLQPAAGRV